MINKWQAMLQQVVRLVSRGYVFFNITEYPLKKIDRWEQIDNKLKQKYGAVNLDRFRAYRRNKKGLAKITVIRWNHICVILHTEGIMPDIEDMDKFSDIRNESLILKISENVIFRISIVNGHVDVRLDRECFMRIKIELQEICAQKNPPLIIRDFNRLNGLLPYHGINEQKFLLRDFTVKEARRHQKKLAKKDLRIYTRMKSYKAYE